MPAWLEEIAGPGYAGAVMWTLVALVVLGVVMLLVKIVRKVSSGSFSSSSGAYRTRLSVMDAAEVDAQRRLVLVRRDEVEHLIMIGGPTDIVIEQNIIGPGRSSPPAPAERPVVERAAPITAVEPVPVERPAPQPVVEREPRPAPVQHRPAPVQTVERAPERAYAPAPVVREPAVREQAEPVRQEPAIAQRVAATDPNVDEMMVSEFENDFRAGETQAAPAQRREPTIEDEMDRLLNETPRDRR